MTQASANDAQLEIGEHPRFEARWRAFQWLVFLLFLLLILAGLAGLSGSGPLATARLPLSGGPFSIEYPRFARARSPERIILRPLAAPSGQVIVHVDNTLAEAWQIKSLSPQPLASATASGGIEFLFAFAPGATGPIVIQAQPDSAGLAHGRVTIGGRSLALRQIIWP